MAHSTIATADEICRSWVYLQVEQVSELRNVNTRRWSISHNLHGSKHYLFTFNISKWTSRPLAARVFLDNFILLQNGWMPLHCASQAGHLNVVKLLVTGFLWRKVSIILTFISQIKQVESGAPTTAQTTNGRTPLWFGASENNLNVVMYLLKQPHDAYNLLDDRKVNNNAFYTNSNVLLFLVARGGLF